MKPPFIPGPLQARSNVGKLQDADDFHRSSSASADVSAAARSMRGKLGATGVLPAEQRDGSLTLYPCAKLLALTQSLQSQIKSPQWSCPGPAASRSVDTLQAALPQRSAHGG